jgi:dihydropyrimidine dehydrogenase (NAD+) subunit PreT
LGSRGCWNFFPQLRGVELRDGNVVVDPETGRTSNPRYYAGGDCVNGGREVVDAVAGKTSGSGDCDEWLI